jgi:hypothetical protein
MSATDTEKPASRPPTWYDVPVAARFTTCECGKRMYWIITQRGKSMPIDCDVEGGRRPNVQMRQDGEGNELIPGRGVPHFGTCPTWEKRRGGTAA